MRRFLLVMSILLIPTLVFGQAQTTGRVTGEVVDEEGNPVAGARVVFLSSALQGERVVTTSDNGKFLAAILPIGPYSVEISAEGMQPVSFSFRLGVGETVPLNVTLKKGEKIVEEVTVYSTATDMETTSLGENFNYRDQVDELPITNRLIEKVAEYAPNITLGPTPNTIAISGAPSYDTTVLLDGAEVSDPYFGSSPTLYLEDAIEEVQVLTAGISARYGRFQGGVLNAVTKTGGNNYDGTLRGTFSNQSWNSLTPYTAETQADDLNEYYQLTVGGFILKDHLWWFGGITEIPTAETDTNTSIVDPPSSITRTVEEERWQLKLRGAITPDHVVELNHLDYTRTQENSVPLPAGNALAIDDREDPRTIDVASYQGVLTPNLFLDVQYTDKQVSISSGGDAAGFDPSFDSAQGAVFNNGWWDPNDPSIRDNETIGMNLTQSLSTANWGTHTLEYGVQWVDSTTGGENKQSPTEFNFYSYSYNIDPVADGGAPFWDHTENPGLPLCTKVGGKSAACSFDTFNIITAQQFNYRLNALPLAGDQQIEDLGLYVNDTWEVAKWRFDIGLRWDDYDGKGPLAYQDFSFDEIAPRVGITYNVDQNWQVQAFYGRYVSRFNDNIFNGTTGVSNAPGVYLAYAGQDCTAAAGSNAGRTLTDGSPIDPDGDGCDAYDIDAINRDEDAWTGGIVLSNNPAFPSTFMSDDVEAPYADDYNFSVKRALPRNTGTLDFSYIHREFHDLMDTFQGAVCDDFNFTYTDPVTGQGGFCSNTSVVDTAGGVTDTRIWGNTAVAQREYNGFVLLANWKPSALWGVGGNYTWGQITGNYEGEGRNTPSSGSPIGNYERGYSEQLAFPSGTLDEEIQNRVRLWGDYRFDFDRVGALVLGTIWSYQSGKVYDHVASTPRNTNTTDGIDPGTGDPTPTGPNCAPGEDANVSPGCYVNPTQGGAFSGFYDGRGEFNFDPWWQWDISARYQFPIWKELGGWVKVDVLNVLNNDELVQYQVTGTVQPNTGTFTEWNPAGNVGSAACPDGSPSETCSGFGRIRNQFDYQPPRQYLLTVGIQF